AADLGQLIVDQLELLVAMLPDFGVNLFTLRHLVDVLVVHWIAVFPAVRLDIGEEAPIDVKEIAARQLHDRVVDRIGFAAGPEPDVRTELVRVAAVVAGARKAPAPALLLDDPTVLPLPAPLHR